MDRLKRNEIIEGVIWKQLLFFFFPIVLGTFFQQFYNTIDAVVVGRFVGKNALAAVGGSAGQIQNLVIGFFTCGREFGVKTVYTSIMLPVFLGIFEMVFPNLGSLTDSQELDVLCYILVVSVGLSIVFNRNASSGGLDIVAKIMNKYLHMDLGRAMSLSGMCVALSAAFVYDKKTVVLSILGTYFNGIVLDHFIFDHNIKRRVCIITEKEEELRNFILNDLHSGATIYESIGAYNMQKRNEIITIVDKNEYQKLMNYMNHEDPKAFITVYYVSDIRYQPKG